MVVAFMYGYLSFLFLILIGYFLYSDWASMQYNRRLLEIATISKKHGVNLSTEKNPLEFSEELFSRLDAIVNLKKMGRTEMFLGSLFFLTLICVYAAILYYLSSSIDVSPKGILSYF